MYCIVVEGGGRGAVSGLRLKGRVCSMVIVMLGGDVDVASQLWVYIWALRPRHVDMRICQTATMLKCLRGNA